ncbi:MAG: hypothetical protein CMH54_05930 [Myxococcales bacterium]|nr:hypothetical protein [Myxococcales bacterium]
MRRCSSSIVLFLVALTGLACGSSATGPGPDISDASGVDIVPPMDTITDSSVLDGSDADDTDLMDTGPSDIANDLDGTLDIPEEVLADLPPEIIDLGNDEGGTDAVSDIAEDIGPGLSSSILYAQPFSLAFAQVPNGQSVYQIVTLRNIGTEDIHISQAEITGSNAFAIKYDGSTYPVGEPLVFAPTHVLESEEQISLMIRFSPSEDGFSSGHLVVHANTEAAVNGLHIPLQGNVEMPCIALSQTQIDFHGAILGGSPKTADLKIESCGNVPVGIESIRLATADDLTNPQYTSLGVEAWSPQFGLNSESLPAPGAPVIVPPDTDVSFELQYEPTETPSALDPIGVPVPDRSFLIIETDSYTPVVVVPLHGYTTADSCPVGIIQTSAHSFVPIGTTILLDGSASYAPYGGVVSYSWSVDQPIDSEGTFIPNSQEAAVNFTVTHLGTYAFRLEVFDETGQASCGRPEFLLEVLAGPLLQVELTWTTTDGQEAPADADLDLHFVSTLADGPDVDGDGQADGYFDPVYDCYWLNPYPNWSEMAEGNPYLSIDNANGGPELVTLQLPQEGLPYRIGAHYWGGPAPMAATIRVLSLGQEVWVSSPVTIQPNSLWSVGTVAWPSLEFQPVLDGQTVIDDYPAN